MNDLGGKRIDWGHESMRWRDLLSSAQIEQAEFVRALLDAGASRLEIEKHLGMRPSRLAAIMRIIDARYGDAADPADAERKVAAAVDNAIENESAGLDASEADASRIWLHDLPVEDIAAVVGNAASRIMAFFRSRKASVPSKLSAQIEDAIFGVMTRARLRTKFMQSMTMKRLWKQRHAEREGD